MQYFLLYFLRGGGLNMLLRSIVEVVLKSRTKKERLHQTAICITVLLVGKQPTCGRDRLADVCQGAQVGLLGLVAMFP